MALTDRFETASLTWMHWLAGALAVVTGLIHLALGVDSLPDALGIAFVLAGLGYGGGLYLALIDWRRPLLYVVGVVFTAVQIVAYYFINYQNDGIQLIGTEGVDKAAQVLLVVILLVLYSRES